MVEFRWQQSKNPPRLGTPMACRGLPRGGLVHLGCVSLADTLGPGSVILNNVEAILQVKKLDF